jgi:hypothetical protein
MVLRCFVAHASALHCLFADALRKLRSWCVHSCAVANSQESHSICFLPKLLAISNRALWGSGAAVRQCGSAAVQQCSSHGAPQCIGCLLVYGWTELLSFAGEKETSPTVCCRCVLHAGFGSTEKACRCEVHLCATTTGAAKLSGNAVAQRAHTTSCTRTSRGEEMAVQLVGPSSIVTWRHFAH